MASFVIKLVLMALALLPLHIFAQPSTLYLAKTGTTFSIAIPPNSTDLHFYFQSPATSWVAVGIGSEMKGALMFFMYTSADKKHVVLSPRIATATAEPTYAPEIEIDILSTTTTTDIENHQYRVEAVCHNCYSWHGGSLDITSPVQDWMYAFGPSNPVASDSLSVGLTQHWAYGKFTMDMVAATGISTSLPPSHATTTLAGVTLVGNQFVADGDFETPTHGYVMAATVFIFAPLMILHIVSGKSCIWLTEAIVGILAVVGLVLGICASLTYNRSKTFNTAHQRIGLAALGTLLILHTSHCITKRHTNPSPDRVISLASYIYWIIGVVVWALAIVNGFLGIKLAAPQHSAYVAYGFVLAAMVVIGIPLFMCMLRRNKKKAKHVTHEAPRAASR